MSAPHTETVLATGYASFLILAAFVIEWLSAHTHRRALRYRTAGFTYAQHLDAWQCPEGEHLWPHEFDAERRLVDEIVDQRGLHGHGHSRKCTPRSNVCSSPDRASTRTGSARPQRRAARSVR